MIPALLALTLGQVSMPTYYECSKGVCVKVQKAPFTNQFEAYPPSGSVIVLPAPQRAQAAPAAAVTAKPTAVARRAVLERPRRFYGHPARRVLRPWRV